MELTKLIEQCCEEKGLPSFMVKGLIKEVENEKGTWLNTLLEWLASRPTCGKEQRLFLNEVEANWYYDEDNDFIANTDQGQESNIFADEMESVDLRKVIRGD